MLRSLTLRPVLIGTAALSATLILIGAGFVAAVDAGYFRGAFTRFLAARSGRQIVIGGTLKSHLFSLHPSITAERVTIGNPPWMPAGTTAEVGKISLLMQAPWFGRSFSIERLQMDAATFYPVRDSTGHANWQWTDPDKSAAKTMPIIHGLSVPGAHMVLDDARRHLQFDGTVSAQEVAGHGARSVAHDGDVGYRSDECRHDHRRGRRRASRRPPVRVVDHPRHTHHARLHLGRQYPSPIDPGRKDPFGPPQPTRRHGPWL